MRPAVAVGLLAAPAPDQGGEQPRAVGFSDPAAEGAPFNLYPVPGQYTVDPADGTGSGLPYEIVATQVGQTP